MGRNNSYVTPLVKSKNDDNVYDVLDVIFQNRSKIFKRINSNISKNIGRNVSNVYYDVTNFFFERDLPDDDITDEDGNSIEKGLRKMGVSKENRKQPIVQMGLFLDDNGIPISIEMFPGNTLDHLTLRTAMKNTVNDLDLNRFILVSGRGVYSGTNICHVINNGNGYIVSKSIKKAQDQTVSGSLSRMVTQKKVLILSISQKLQRSLSLMKMGKEKDQAESSCLLEQKIL